MKSFFKANNKDFSEFFSHRIIDTSSILYFLYLSRRIKRKAVSSDAAFELFNINVEGRHTALGDAIATAELFNRLLHIVR
jgi:DNA polymerase III epsilon subunit-like protein